MSLVTLLLRIVTVKALTGKTFAAVRVCDSEIDPVDMKVAQGGEPLIVVYTDDAEGTFAGSDMLASERKVNLVLHLAVANRVMDEAGAEAIEIPHTDEGLEAVLDLMGHDALVALQSSDDHWCDLWRGLVFRLHSITKRRGAGATKGLRFAAHEITLQLDTLADPVAAALADDGFFQKLDAALRSDRDLVGMADLIKARWSGRGNLPDWQRVKALLGLGSDGASALGLSGRGDVPATSLGIAAPRSLVKWESPDR